jgi:LuxR family transcriptional regulator, maltose regulon positive regulatory protein
VRPLPTTKLRPPRAGATLIARPRLEACFDAARETARVTLVVAPAGYGKTTAVSAWLRRREAPTAWFTVDPGDDPTPAGTTDPASATNAGRGTEGRDHVARRDAEGRVAHWLTAALTAARAWPHAADDPVPTSDPTLVAARLERAGWRGVVVFDDVHHLGAAACDALATWVERAPDGVHTVLLARLAPALPVARWLARSAAEWLGTEHLRLTADEGRALLDRLSPELDPELAAALVARVEGWPAGVHLAARSLRGKADPSDAIARFTGTDRFVLAFLTEEVLLRLPDELHEAALLLAGEPRLCAGLVEAITGRPGGAAVLARLEAHEAFLERLEATDDDAPWYRFPDFFRDLLAHRLALAHPGLAAELAARSLAWWRERDRARAAGDALTSPLPATAAGGLLAEPLTERERQVLTLLVGGATTKAVARQLGLSPNTVKTHTRHVFEKLGVRTRTEAAAVARRAGLD